MSTPQAEYHLSYGKHASGDDGRCAMEWVSYLAGEPHSDQPRCVSPVLTVFCIRFNDALPDDRRQRLRPYLARTIGTRGDGLDKARGWMCADWLIRTYTPAWLSLAGLGDHADRIRSLPGIVSSETLQAATGDLHAAGDAAGAAAWDAAWAAAGDAAGAAAGDAAWAAAGDAARAAAWDAARAAAWAAARAAAWDAAGAAAWAAARAAAWAAARDALAPTVEALQESAFALLDRMLPIVPLRVPVAADAHLVCASVELGEN